MYAISKRTGNVFSDAVLTTEHSASSYGQDVLLIGGRLVDRYLYDTTARFLMNPHTGSVDTAENWAADAERDGWDFETAELVDVVPDGSGGWREADHE